MKKIIITASLFLSVGCQSQQAQQACNANCMVDTANLYMQEVQKQDFSRLPWAEQVRYTENNVAMMIGDGFWGAGPAVESEELVLADPETGNVFWYGITSEHGQAAYHGLRLKVDNGEISEVESYLGREGQPDLFSDTSAYSLSPVFAESLPSGEHVSRRELTDTVEAYFATREQNDGSLEVAFSEDCTRVINGVDTGYGDYPAAQVSQGCRAQYENGLYNPVDDIRAVRFPVVDVERGVVLALSLEDHAVRYVDYEAVDGTPLKVEVEYPNARGLFELFKIRDGAIERIEGVSVFLPYYIHNLWE